MFTVMASTRLRRRRFCPNFRSLRLPERQQGRSGWPAETRWTEPNTPQSRQSLRKHSTLGFVRCPVSVWCPPPDYPGYSVAGVRFPVGQLSASLSLFDSPYSLFVKHRLLAAWVAPHGYLLRPALSPLRSIPQALRPQDASPAGTGRGATDPNEDRFAHSISALHGARMCPDQMMALSHLERFCGPLIRISGYSVSLRRISLMSLLVTASSRRFCCATPFRSRRSRRGSRCQPCSGYSVMTG
jgi:hypothetical protein